MAGDSGGSGFDDDAAARLRQEAEKRAGRRGSPSTDMSADELNRLVYELQVHQIELEMQNEELLKAQVEIEESRHRYSDLYDFAPVGYATLDENGVIEDINLAGSLMLGKVRSLLIGRPFTALVARHDIRPFLSHLRQCLEAEGLTTAEVSLSTGGGALPVQLTSVPIGQRGQKKFLRTVISSIAERKKVEEELSIYRARLEALVEERTAELKNEVERHRLTERRFNEREENFKSIMGSSTHGILMLMDGCVVLANARLTEILGFTQEELCGLAFTDLLHPGERASVGSRIIHILDGRQASYRCETVFIAKGGESVPVELISTMTTWQGENAGLVMLSDVTMRKKMEEEMSRAQKLESVGVLAGGIAHDFNNMLTGILGNITMAAYELQPESKALSWLAEAEKATVMAGSLTQQLLTFSKGGAPIKELFSAGNVLRESVSFALSGSKVSCEFLIPVDLSNVEADKGQINQVIQNIVINAVQSMPDGGTISVGAENTSVGAADGLPLQEGKYIRISIEDHGHGIPREYLHKIFDPYFTTKAKGSGLGLATTYAIVKKHGGYISVTSEAGIGTTFYVYLPASEKKVVLNETEGKEMVGGSGRVLVMDDQEMIRDTAGAILGAAGYDVEFAEDGEQAIALYKRAASSGRPFDIVIMDLTIPGGMGGKDAIKALRALCPGVKAIVSSGYSNETIAAEYENYGFDGVITKPYTPQALTKTVSDVLVGRT